MNHAATSLPATVPQPRSRADESPSVAAQLCWHASAICRALDRGVEAFQASLVEAAEHTDAIVELAIHMAAGPVEGRELPPCGP